MGGEAPTLSGMLLGKETAASTTQIDAFRCRLLAIKVCGPMGRKNPAELKLSGAQNPAVLEVNIKLKLNLPPGSGPKPRTLGENDSPDPPSGPPGGGGGTRIE